MSKSGKSTHKAARTSAGPRLASIMSGKGGVGKSVIAFNLAERAAHLGLRTLLVDADLSCGNLHILANVDPGNGFDMFAVGQKSLFETAVTIKDNLTLLSRSSGDPAGPFVSVEAVAAFAARLRVEAHDHDLVVIDHGSGVSPSAAVLAHASDLNLLVLAPELTSIADCYGLCKYLYQTDRAMDCRLLFNRIESEDEAEYVWTRFSAMAEQFLGQIPGLAGALPEDALVRKSVAGQCPISALSSESSFLRALANVISGLGWGVPSQAASTQTREINIVTATADIRE
jgi:flagellar biosynthesis protein FlhG